MRVTHTEQKERLETMFEQRTLKSLAEQIHQMKGSVGPVPKPKDKATAIKIIEKLIAEENRAYGEKKTKSDALVSKLPEGEIGNVNVAGKVEEISDERDHSIVEHTTTHHVTVETIHTVTTNTVVTDKMVQEDINVVIHGKTPTSNVNVKVEKRRKQKKDMVIDVEPKTSAVRKMNDQPHCRFDKKIFTLTMDNSVQHKALVDAFPTQARLLLLAWKKNERTVTGDRLVQICEKDGPRGVRSAKLIIQRYMTYFVRQGLATYGAMEVQNGKKANHA